MGYIEWTLVLFTLLIQLTAGAFLMSRLIPLFAGSSTGEMARLNYRVPEYLLPFLILALISFLAHLGSFNNIYLILTDFSDFSAKVDLITILVFSFLILFLSLYSQKRTGGGTIYYIINFLAAVSSIGVIYLISRWFVFKNYGYWDSFFAPSQFFIASLLIGVLFMAAIGQRVLDLISAYKILRVAAVCSIILFGVEFIIIPLGIANLAVTEKLTLEGIRVIITSYRGLLVFRLSLLFIGSGLFPFLLYRRTYSDNIGQNAVGMAYLAFFTVFLSEGIGRFIFYASYAKVKLLI